MFNAKAWFSIALGVAGCLSAAPTALAQEYPARPVKIIVPFSAGGAVDGPTRLIAQELSKRLGQQFLVENKPGAGATIGADQVAKSPADGYTLLLMSQTNAISASLYKSLPYDAVGDFAPISLLAREPGVLVVHPSFPAKSVREFMALVAAEPRKHDYASSGNGSGQHLFMAMMAAQAGLSMNHIPYKGSAQATTDVLAGLVKVSFPGMAGMMGHLQAGKLRALAVSSERRAPTLPDVPTLAESGLSGFSAYVWMGLYAPKATPAAIIAKLNTELQTVMGSETVKAYMNKASLEAIASSPAEMGAYFIAERDRWAKVIRDTGAKID